MYMNEIGKNNGRMQIVSDLSNSRLNTYTPPGRDVYWLDIKQSDWSV